MKTFSFVSFLAAAFLTLVVTSNGAVLTVTTTNDSGPGSFRERIDVSGIGDTIAFGPAVTGTITLTNGDLVLRRNTFIDGPGPGKLIISGFGTNGVFQIVNFGSYRITGLTIANGRSWGSSGGGIYNFGDLLISNCVVRNNRPADPACAGCVSRGGGIFNDGTLTIINSTITSNRATVGGGICNNLDSAKLTILSSTISGNSASSGGGIAASGTLAMTNCTIVGNQADAPGPSGGGVNVSNLSPPAKVRNTIIAANVAANTAPDVVGSFMSQGFNFIGSTNWSTGFGAAEDRFGNNIARLDPKLSPLQDNGGPTPTCAPLPGSRVIDRGHSSGLVFDQRGVARAADLPGYINTLTGDASDIGAVELSSLGLIVSNTRDTAEGSLRYALLSAHQGGSNVITFEAGLSGVITLTSGSLVIESNVTIQGPGADLLGVSGQDRGRVFELLAGKAFISGLTIQDGTVSNSVGFFEQDGARARGGGIFNQTTLALTECIISNNCVVGGQGGETTSGFAGGGGNGLGGGIFNAGLLFLTNCTLLSNTALGGQGGMATAGGTDGSGGQGFGGAIESETPATLVGCSITGNRALGGGGNGGPGSGSGGGVYNLSDLALYTSTIASNLAGGSSFDFGGGIYDSGTSLLLRSCTISGNEADFGGGISGSADLGNTVLAGNIAGASPDCSGFITSSDYNLIQNTSGTTISGATARNITGQNPLLGPLKDNGGPTFTMALLPGSPAVDKGRNFNLSRDQRGAPRPFDKSISNATGGDGTDIGAFEVGGVVQLIFVPQPVAADNISFATDAGQTYELQRRDDLRVGGWMTVLGDIAGTGGTVTIPIPDSEQPQGFFRIRLLP